MEDAMNKKLSANESIYTPQFYKTFTGALESFLNEECPQLGGNRTRQVLVQSINNMVLKFFPKANYLKQGQTPWTTVHKDEKMSYGKSIRKTRLTHVVLDVIQERDALDRSKGKKLRDIKKEAVARLHHQAYEQKGCLTNTETAILLKISPNTVGKYIKEWEEENKSVIPRRGTIHDIGPSLTHKKIIIEKLFIEKKSVQQVSRETYHSLEAIQRYISTFRQVLLCRKKNFSVEETAYAIRKSIRLTKEYFNIIEEYQNRGYVIEKIEKHEIESESNLQKDINYMMELQGQMSV
jgi:predicted transcriptional regulator